MTDTELLAKVTQARKRLLLDYPWFGTLALMLKVELSDKPKHAAHTDGTFIRFRPDYVEKASVSELVVLWAHEVCHCALQHPFRRGHRDMTECNIAADYAINPILKAAGMEIPAGWLIDPQYEGMSMEGIYAKRQGGKQEPPKQNPPQQPPPSPQGKQKPGPGAGAGQPQPQQQGKPQPGAGGKPQPGNEPSDDSGQPGEFGDAPPEAVEASKGASEKGTQSSDKPGPQSKPTVDKPGATQTAPAPKMTAEDWKIAAEQASRVCAKAGNDPGAAGRAAKATHEPDTDWRGEMQEFIQHQTPSDYSWSSPNRRHIANGLYLPGIHKENLGTIVWVTDSSGSINDKALSLGWAEFVALVRECKPEKVMYLSCDTRCHLLGEYTPDDIPDEPPIHKGGGGTWFQPPFDYIANRDEEPPVCLLYYSADLLNSDHPTEPDYPVLWIAPVSCRKSGAFGKTVRIDAWGN